jgi:hypothetical protein
MDYSNLLSYQQSIFADNVGMLIEEISKRGYHCTFGEALRSPEQAELYAKEGKGIADSLHCKKLAVDLNLFSNDYQYITDYKEYVQFGDYWESLSDSNRWGGYFVSKYGGHLVDSDHFERNFK